MMRKNGKSKKTGIFGLRNKIYLCFLVPIVFIILFLGFGTLEVVWNPGQLILCLAYLVHHPMFGEMSEEIAVD